MVDRLYSEVGLTSQTRFPLTYIMEAADDIAYCMGDISDGIEKNILTAQQFREEFLKTWEMDYPNSELLVKMPEEIKNFNRDISIPWSKIAMKEAAENFINKHNEFYSGKADELIPNEGIGLILKTVKKVSRKILYSSIEAESIELTGFAIITSIFKHYCSIRLVFKLEPGTA